LIFFAIFIYFFANPLIIFAEPQRDALQLYRDEIKTAETTATQTVLDQLGPNINDSSGPYSNTHATQAESLPTASSSEKAFTPPTAETQKSVKPIPHSPARNPWSKPNPWAKQSKENPWANAPIPSPTIPNGASATNGSSTSPPNIFAPPPKTTDDTLNKTADSNHTSP